MTIAQRNLAYTAASFRNECEIHCGNCTGANCRAIRVFLHGQWVAVWACDGCSEAAMGEIERRHRVHVHELSLEAAGLQTRSR